MEIFNYIFVSLIAVTGLFLILLIRGALRGDAPPDDLRERQLNAYEERRMRVKRDRVWWRVESLYSEFTERQAAVAHIEARAPAPLPARAVEASDGFTPVELKAAFEKFIATHQDGPGAGQTPAV